MPYAAPRNMPRVEPFLQRLEGFDLSIERATDRSPDRRRYHVFLDGRLVDWFRSLRDAPDSFRRLRDESGWVAPDRAQLSPAERLERQRADTERLDYLEYWGTSHQHRARWNPRRRKA